MRRASIVLASLILGILLLSPSLDPQAQTLAGPYDAYKDLTRAEKWLVFRYPWQVLRVYRAATFARTESTTRFPGQSGQDDARDAHRHATWNGVMTSRLKSLRSAERWGNAHEEIQQNPAVRKQMDLTNNRRGRDRAWARRTTSGPWWWRSTSFPSDGEIANDVERGVRGGDFVMVEAVNGQRDPHAGSLVPTR
jgi:hypothetical protein